MQALISKLSQSASLKVAIIGFLVLVLLIPVSMINGVIIERESVRHVAKSDIARTWGFAQMVGGPVLIVPYVYTSGAQDDRQFTTTGKLYVLPKKLDISAKMRPEVRYRGLHEVPVYRASMTISGSFSDTSEASLDIAATEIRWNDAVIAFLVSDSRAITESPVITVDGETLEFAPGNERVGDLTAPIVAPAGKALEASGNAGTLEFKMTLHVNGTDELNFLPFGDTTTVRLGSTWTSPSFTGGYLPHSREIDDNGFSADWRVSSIGRAVPSRWTTLDNFIKGVESSAFGVELYMPVSLYRLTLRATKYAILFIGLTFVSYLMFEVVAALKLHPLQYLLVGFANALFYLLLISLSEHAGFGLAYVISCLASCGLIVGYSYSVLGSWIRAAVMAAILVLLYGFLYMTLQAEDYALLSGSLGLWVGLALIMYMTRRVDWYTVKTGPVDSAEKT